MELPEFSSKYTELNLEIYDPKGEIDYERYGRLLDELKVQSQFDMFDKGFKVHFTKDKDQFEVSLVDSDSLGKKVMRFEVEKYHINLVANIRYFAAQHKLLCFDPILKMRLPKSEYLLPFTYVVNQEEFKQVFDKSPFELAFVFVNARDKMRITEFYGKARNDGSIHILNPYLVNFLIKNKDYDDSPELAYKIADSVEDYVVRDDAGILPRDFYKFYKKPHKIINYSTFDIHSIDRKVFFHPFVYELSDPFTDLNKLPGGGGLADKVRRGETLDQAIRRVLSDELKLADDYIGAFVQNLVEFDRDRENKLTPRLLVSIFINKGSVSDETKKTMQRSWRSLKKDTD